MDTHPLGGTELGEMFPYFPLTFTQPDYAFKAVENPFIDLDIKTFHDLETVNLPCGDDTIHVDGTYKNDNYDLFTYHWNFGNGQTSNIAHPTVIYSQPGTYTTTLIVIETTGVTDTLTQKFIVPNCDEQKGRVSQNSESSLNASIDEINIFPNPNNGNFTILFPEKNKNSYTIELYDITGRKILRQENVTSKIELKVEQEMQGMYLLKIISNDSIVNRKILIQ